MRRRWMLALVELRELPPLLLVTCGWSDLGKFERSGADMRQSRSGQRLTWWHLCDFLLYKDVLSVSQACSLAEYGGNVIQDMVEMLLCRLGWLIFYLKTGQVDIARSVLEGMPQPDLVSCNAMIAGCSWNGFADMTLDALAKIWVDDLRPNGCTLANIIPVCSRLGCLTVGKALHGYAMKSEFHSDESLPSALISMYVNNGDIIAARRLFDLSPIENIIT
ncbi:hypothetical protein Dimus_018920 [Dionaea muscipula]